MSLRRVATLVTMFGAAALGVNVAGAAPPAAPTGLTATLASPSQVNLSWTRVTGAAAYRVLRGTVSGGPYSQIGMCSAPNFSNMGLALNKTYYYVVQAYNGTFSPSSAQVTATTGSSPAPQIPPSPPTDLTATAVGGRIALTWTASTGAAVYHYDILRGTTSGGEVAVDSVQGNLTAYDDFSAPGAAGLYYQVRAYGAYGSSTSVEVFVPGAPTLTATTRSAAQIDLSWTPSTNATSYNVLRGTSSGGPFTQIATVTAPTTTHPDSGLAADTTYFYVVQAVATGGTGSGTSLDSNVASATTNPITTVSFLSGTASPGEGDGSTVPVVVLTTTPATSPLRAPVTVDLVSGSGSATAGTDFSGTPLTLTFPIGSVNNATQSPTIAIADDTLVEGNESVSLDLQNAGPSGNSVGSQGSQLVTIADNDFASYSFFTTSSAADQGTAGVQVVVVLSTTGSPSATPTLAASVPTNYTLSGTAASPADYTIASAPTFLAGDGNNVTRNFSLNLVNTGAGTAKTVVLTLQTSVPITVGATPSHTLTINAAAVTPLSNGSFETGDYAGWTLASTFPPSTTWANLPTGTTLFSGTLLFDYLTGTNHTLNSVGLPLTFTSSHGTRVAVLQVHGAADHRMFQTVTVPVGATRLKWEMSYKNNNTGGFHATQTMRLNVRSPTTDAILATPFEILPGAPQVVPAMTTFQADVSAFQGQTVRIDVMCSVQSFYLDVAFDNFRFE